MKWWFCQLYKKEDLGNVHYLFSNIPYTPSSAWRCCNLSLTIARADTSLNVLPLELHCSDVLDSPNDTSLLYSQSCLTMCRFLQLNLSVLDSYRRNLYEPGPYYVCTVHLVTQTHPWGKVSPTFLFINSQVRFPELKNFILLHRFLFFYLFPLFGGRKQTFLVLVLVAC